MHWRCTVFLQLSVLCVPWNFSILFRLKVDFYGLRFVSQGVAPYYFRLNVDFYFFRSGISEHTS